MRSRPPRWPLPALAVLCASVAGCGNEGGSDACGPITRESLDPAYLVHVVGGEGDVAYLSDPPTSGPHQPGPAVSGVVGEPLPPPVQVGVLERGDVLLQHGPDLDDASRQALEDLSGDRVVVAPNPGVDTGGVVATAWVFKRTCDAVDVSALEEFVDERVGKGPES